MSHLASWDTLTGFALAWIFGAFACAVFLNYYEMKRPCDWTVPLTDAQKKEINNAICKSGACGGFIVALFWLFHHTQISN
jgi:hypothetical protein